MVEVSREHKDPKKTRSTSKCKCGRESRGPAARTTRLTSTTRTWATRTIPPVLLIMGLGAQLLLWRKGFCEKLVDQGLRVIRYDNRDVGLSSKLTGRHTGARLLPRMARSFARHAQPGGLHAGGHGRRRRRAARPPGHRARPHRRRVDGRHDRADLRGHGSPSARRRWRSSSPATTRRCCRRRRPSSCVPSCSGPRTPPAT